MRHPYGESCSWLLLPKPNTGGDLWLSHWLIYKVHWLTSGHVLYICIMCLYILNLYCDYYICPTGKPMRQILKITNKYIQPANRILFCTAKLKPNIFTESWSSNSWAEIWDYHICPTGKPMRKILKITNKYIQPANRILFCTAKLKPNIFTESWSSNSWAVSQPNTFVYKVSLEVSASFHYSYLEGSTVQMWTKHCQVLSGWSTLCCETGSE